MAPALGRQPELLLICVKQVDSLFATNLRDGLIGRVRFDANGDVSSSPVTILRVAAGTRVGPEAPDAAGDRVILVPADAVR